MARSEASKDDVDQNLALFAAWSRDEDERERDQRRAAKAARDQERKADDLVRAKDEAAAALKRVRQDPRSTAEEKSAADTAYRSALAAVVAAETGEAPAWAPEAPATEVDEADADAATTDRPSPDGADPGDSDSSGSSEDDPSADQGPAV